jgi:hypothetical protein
MRYQMFQLNQHPFEFVDNPVAALFPQGGDQGAVVPELLFPVRVESAPEILSNLPVVR